MTKTPNIIAISGRIGSGKDTVGKIIQSLSSDVCKNDPAELNRFLNSEWAPDFYSNWEIKKFATKLKEIASILTGIPVRKFEDQEFKKTHLGPEWSTCVEAMPFADLTKTNMELKMTVRELLQKIGTDCMRGCLHDNVWVNALFADYFPVHHDHVPGGLEYPKWIITDCRFPNEARAIKDRGGIIVRVERETDYFNDHISETALNDWEFDYIINNNGTIEELIEEVKFRFPDL